MLDRTSIYISYKKLPNFYWSNVNKKIGIPYNFTKPTPNVLRFLGLGPQNFMLVCMLPCGRPLQSRPPAWGSSLAKSGGRQMRGAGGGLKMWGKTLLQSPRVVVSKRKAIARIRARRGLRKECTK